jgi:hypothetical protein
MDKPTSKIVQIATSTVDISNRSLIIALCEDGSIWERSKINDLADHFPPEFKIQWSCVFDPNS